jgi:acid stress-induced BolA-like protein IbaG/YrbA
VLANGARRLRKRAIASRKDHYTSPFNRISRFSAAAREPVTIQIHYFTIKVGYTMHAQEIEHLIEEQLPGARATVRGDDGIHFDAVVVSDLFAGKSPVQQHRLVYAALGGRMEREEIHALSLKTYTPDAWRTQQN